MKNPHKISSLIELSLIPLYFFGSSIPQPFITNYILSLLLFYFLPGFITLLSIIQLLTKEPFKKETNPLSLIQIAAFSFILGIIFNIIYGIFAVVFSFYTYRAIYFLFFEVIAGISFLFSLISKSQVFEERNGGNSKEGKILLIILLPTALTVLQILISSPYPLMAGWDIWRYQGISGEFFAGIRSYLFKEGSLRTVGFNFIQVNFLISSNLPVYFLIEFDKFGLFLTNGLSSIIVYLICFQLTKSKSLSAISSIIIAPFRHNLALGPIFFLPSSFSWLFGLVIMYLLLLNKSNETRVGKLIILVISFLFLFLISAMFHIFTTVALIIVFFLFIIVFSPFFKKNQWILVVFLISELILVFFHQFQIVSSLSSSIFDFINSIFISEEITIFSIKEMNTILFCNANPFISPVIGIISSLILLVTKKKDSFPLIFSFFFILSGLFAPIKSIIRIYYILVVLNAILLALALRHFPIVKITKMSQIFHQIVIDPLKKFIYQTTNYKFTNISNHLPNRSQRKVIILTPFIVYLILSGILVMYNSIPRYTIQKVYDSISDGNQYSSYSREEFSAAVWINREFFNKSVYLYSDISTERIFYGLTGVSTYELNFALFQNELMTCTETGLSDNFLVGFRRLLGRDFLLVLTPRSHKWVQTGAMDERYIVESSWINSTLILYLDNTINLAKVYNNTEVSVYQYVPL